MKLPAPTKAIIVTAATSGVITFAVAVAALFRHPTTGASQLALFATLTALVAATWAWPLVMYRQAQSEALNLDEGFFIIMALLLPVSNGVLIFALAVAVAQCVSRRPLVKSIFNWGQAVTAAGLGLFVTHLLAPATPKLTVPEVGAAVVGAVVFSIVNTGAVVAIVASLGTPWRTALEGMEIRLKLMGSCHVLAIMSALAIAAYPWSVPVAVLPLLILRQVLAGHFQARHDRTRVLGLFDAALDANRSLGEGDVLSAILESARSLLRCPEATVSAVPATAPQLGAMMPVNGEPSWLVVSGRSRTEPFDAADKALLEALAAVGAGALTNVHHYREGRFQRERLAAITASLGEGVCALDQAGRVTFMNPAAAYMLGAEPISASAAALRSFDEADSPITTPDFLLGPARQVMATRQTVRNDDTEFTRDGGETIPVAFTASAILDGDTVAGVVIVFRDISERREVETAIRDARDKAIEASRLKSQFLANMSHEIRTPMNGVLGMSRMLLETDVDESQRKYLAAIRDSGENLMVIINDILDFSKIEAGKLSLENVDFDLGASLTSVTNALGVQAQDKALQLHLNVDPALPRRVRGDPVRFRQVLTNLVGNAVKFTPEGSVTVTATALGHGRVRLEVVDTGIGIDNDLRSTVLDAFGQADSSTTRRYGGTGLGLAICHQLVGMMGGVLDFTSELGQGSTFWFELPFAEASSASDDEPIPSARDLEESISFTSVEPNVRLVRPRRPTLIDSRRNRADGPRVLVADDAPVSQLVASLRLERMGYQVDTVATGQEALEAVRDYHYAAVLMDCRMGVMDGYEAARRIRQLEGPAGATPIIAMTASLLESDEELCRQAGMDEYLIKPLDAKELAAALSRASRTARSRCDASVAPG
jgi:PAS domain S-box-containing protein